MTGQSMIRPAQADDLVAVLALEQGAFGADSWAETTMAEALSSPDRKVVVACRAQRVVGFAVAALAGDALDLERIVVAPQQRRGAVAAALFDVIRCGAPARCRRLMIEVSEANVAARAFYAARGMTVVARRKGYYQDGSDALILSLPLRAGEAAS